MTYDITISDDRSSDAEKSLPLLVLMTDRFLSGWGEARSRPSYAAWACSSENLDCCLFWVRSRSDAKNVRIVSRDYRPSHSAHLHIYVWKGDRS